jgi:hypothetical protein
MRRVFVMLSLVSPLGCADDTGGPRVATDAQAPADTGPTTPAGKGKPGPGKGPTAPSPAPAVAGAAPIQP